MREQPSNLVTALSTSPPFDAIDHQIVALLQENARRTLADIAAHVSLSVAPVKRRIDRLEATGIITGYTAVVNRQELGSSIEAVIWLRVAPGANISETLENLRVITEVGEVLATSGEQDMIVRISVEDIDHLRRTVNKIRHAGAVTETRTHIVLERWQRGGR